MTTGVAGRFLEARLGKPSLVRETSRASGTALVTQPLRKAAGQMGVPEWAGGLPPTTGDVLDGVILDKPVTREKSRDTSRAMQINTVHMNNYYSTTAHFKACAIAILAVCQTIHSYIFYPP